MSQDLSPQTLIETSTYTKVELRRLIIANMAGLHISACHVSTMLQNLTEHRGLFRLARVLSR